MRNSAFLMVFAIVLSSCATEPDATYVSAAQYESYNCRQLKSEMSRISNKIDAKTESNKSGDFIDAAVAVYSISQGYGYSDSPDPELKRLQNSYDVLDGLLIKKDCAQ